MKKNYLLGFFALATMLFTASCQEEELVDAMANTNVITYKVSTQQVATRAAVEAGQGDKANKLYYGVYELIDGKWDLIETSSVLGTNQALAITEGTPCEVPIRLAKQKKYSVIFWAQSENEKPLCTVNWGARQMSINTDLLSNQESYDAFWGYDEVELNGAMSKNVDLKRPFAQLNIGTSDFADAVKASVIVESSAVTVTGLPTTLNLETGDVVEAQNTHAYGLAAIPSADVYAFPVESAKYQYLALNYVLVGSEKSIIDVELSYKDSENQEYSSTFTAVPVQRNYRTNIYGTLLTNDANYTVDIKPVFTEPAENIKIWDGESLSAPTIDEDAKAVTLTQPDHLAWLAASVNGTLPTTSRAENESQASNTYEGWTIKLTEDIDLGSKEWTPIGNSTNKFLGTFDGQNHVVKNLVINGGSKSNQGLFGMTTNGEIKNLVVENAKVSGRLNVGVVAGTPYTSKYTNITLKGHVEVNGMAYVGGVGGKDAYADWTNIIVDVDATSYVKANSVENGTAYRTYVGGVVGFNGEGGHTFKNIESNINVEGSTIDVGGLFGIAHYGNKFENCVCTGKVVNTTDDAENALQTGGIAGVWNNGGENVVFTNCSFEGELSAPNVGDVNFYYNGLVGAPYYADKPGKLIINGEVAVASFEALQAAIDAAVEGETTIALYADMVDDVTVVQKKGVKITINGKGKKFNGSIKVHSNSNHYADAALTIQNVNFESSAASVNFIEALENGAQRYSTNITVDGCTFTATGEGENTSVGVQIKASKNAKVLNSTATGVHSLLQAQSCDETVVVTNCEINGKNGVAFKQVKAATVEGTTITATGYGIRFDGNTDNYGITVKNNNVTAVQPFIVRKMTGKNNTIALEGTNTLTTEAEYQVVITNGSDDEEYVKPTGTYTLTGADAYSMFPEVPVAKVGNTEYTSIDEAIKNWTNNTTLTLMADVTLTDVITLKSTEYHILDLGTCTMTAAKGKDAIAISNEGRSSASYALDIKADATNPGGITATSKAVVKTTGKSGVKDRPIIRFYNGVFNASNVISHGGSNGTNCPQFQFHGGVYNANLSANRAMIQIYGGTFNGRFFISVDSSAYGLISGGKFKYMDNLYGSALNSDKFTIGSSKGNFDRGVYVDDEGYIVVGGPVITEFGDQFAAKATNVSKAGSYLPYSSAAANGLYYTNAELAIQKHGEANVVLPE